MRCVCVLFLARAASTSASDQHCSSRVSATEDETSLLQAVETRLKTVSELDPIPPSKRALNITGCTKTELPLLMLMGLPHAGSTSFANQLNLHPNLSYGYTKEHRFFATRGSPAQTVDTSVPDYLSGFNVPCDVTYTFDANPNTLYLGQPRADHHGIKFLATPGLDAVKLTRTLLGDVVRFILLIRDPVDLLNSRYGLASIQDESYHWFTCFAESLANWFAVFARQSFLILRSEDYFVDEPKSLAIALDFLGLPSREYTASELEPSGRRRTSVSRISSETRRAFHMQMANQKCKQDLEEMTQMRFAWPES